jgi:carotenoid cleavage dioxygenase
MEPSPYLLGNYAPTDGEQHHPELRVVQGAVPRDLDGAFVRNGPNLTRPPAGRHHWFDGDAMVHAVAFEDGRASYRSRWIETAGLRAEREAGRALWTGLLDPIDLTNPRGPYKNTANTDLVFHHGRVLALWWMSGDAYALRLPDLATTGVEDFRGTYRGGLTAHPKVDPRTGELMFIRFGPRPPYLSYGVIAPDGRLAHLTDVELPGPRLQHDIAITERHTILLDMAMHEDPELLARGKVRVRFFREDPSRFGLIPRRGVGREVRWFEASPCYIYHTINAWETEREVTLLACRIDDPMAGDPTNTPSSRVAPVIGFQQLRPHLCRYRFDLRSGRTTEEILDDELTEFPRIDARRLGVPSEVSYHQRLAEAPTLLFDAVVRYDHERGKRTVHRYPEGSYGGETVFAPRTGATA